MRGTKAKMAEIKEYKWRLELYKLNKISTMYHSMPSFLVSTSFIR